MLIARNLSFSYTGEQRLEFPDIECKRGEQWLLIGQSGSGKTTLLHLLAGLRTPKSGRIQINNTTINELPSGALDRFRGKNIGIIFQQAHFVQSLNVEENLALAQHLAGLKKDKMRIRKMLAHLNVGHKLNSKPNQLSVGEQQRVAIARALVNNPAVVLADEPTSALDDHNTTQVIDLLKEQAALTDTTLLIVTHDNRLKSIIEKQIQL